MTMKTKVTEQGITIPKKFLKGIKEVEIRKENNVVLVVPITDDPILQLGSQPIDDTVTDASENHDAYIYGK
jgi:virulence-associated protein VagC